MCRLFAICSAEPVSPLKAVNALNVMREGHDGSGVGLFLRDLGGPFDEMRDAPILSGIFTDEGLKHLSRLTKLRNLELYDTQVTDEGVRKLTEVLPKCNIHR